MTIPTLKRIKVSSAQDLRNWLSQNATHSEDVMVVTCDKTSRTKHVSNDEVRQTLLDNGWTAGRSYTLNGNLIGHVAHPG